MPTAQERKSQIDQIRQMRLKNGNGLMGEMYDKLLAKLEEDYSYQNEQEYTTKVTEAQGKIEERANEFADPNSKLYSSFRKSLTSSLAGANSTNSLLAMVMAQGGSFTQAQEKIKALRAKIDESAISGTESFYGNMQGQANQLYGTNLGSKQSMMQYFGNMNLQNKQLAQQQQQFEDSQPTFWDNLLNVGGTVGGYALGGLFGKKS